GGGARWATQRREWPRAECEGARRARRGLPQVRQRRPQDRIHRVVRVWRAGVAAKEGPGARGGSAPRRAERGPADAVRAQQARHPLLHREDPGGGAGRFLAVTTPLRLDVRRPAAGGESEFELSLDVPSDLGYVGPAVELIADRFRQGVLSPRRVRFNLRTALAAARANAIAYGNRLDARRLLH